MVEAVVALLFWIVAVVWGYQIAGMDGVAMVAALFTASVLTALSIKRNR